VDNLQVPFFVCLSAVNIDDLERPWTLKIRDFNQFFGIFGLRHTFYEWITPKLLEIEQDNLHIKCSALNADFSSPKFQPPRFREACACERQSIIASTSDELFSDVNIDDLEWPWTPKIVGFRVLFCNFQLQRIFLSELRQT